MEDEGTLWTKDLKECDEQFRINCKVSDITYER